MNPRTYVLSCQGIIPDSTVHATSASDAVRKAAAGKEGVYVAVPQRSFQPVKVRVETTTHLRIEDA